MSRALAIALPFALSLLCLAPASAAPGPTCSDRLQQAMIAARNAPAGQQASNLILYVKFYLCLGYSTTEARGLAAMRLQLARAAEAYVAGSLAPPAYRAFILDRQRKAERMRKSPSYAAAVARGDRDGDLIPDRDDRCPRTAPYAATDDKGCDVQCPPAGTVVRNPDPVCLAAAPPHSAEDPLRPLLDASVPVNLSCEDVTPAASAPIAWGERSTTVISGRPVPFATVDTKSGYYFRVRRTSPQAAGCEVWYALQFVFRNPSSAGLPPLDIVSVLFSSNEDEDTADRAIARFAMITHHGQIEGDVVKISTDLPLSAGRTRLRDDLLNYSDVSVRVRVVTGAQQASPWSAYVEKPRDVAIGD